MIVFGSSLSPYVRKTLAFGAEKGLVLENRVSPPGTLDPDFAECSPFRKIPAFQDGDFRISDSSAIITYLEALHPEPNLIPAEPRARARAVWFEEYADTILVAAGGKIFFNRIVAPRFMRKPGDEAIAAKAQAEELPPVLDYLETIVPDAGGFLLEGRLTLADIAVASPFANLRHLALDLSHWPRTKAYTDAILARPSFAELIAREEGLLAMFAAPTAA
ncbi:glutathione S-transferase [Caulobacter sp. D4A]|uniref:glutathione S-transferase family protein n=1 Tax=unclassified Caulobacter TaxID=2648921 RepID=UPI000D734E8F|nr:MULTISPECIES: glutathione S-transferase family protein [unclassified Caulobacter]PXA93759.1 glutathione S-transferase [Caulobacter sp. D4A]PXA94598.1 glutathione S-transferase [Caulobacter sp. D5]